MSGKHQLLTLREYASRCGVVVHGAVLYGAVLYGVVLHGAVLHGAVRCGVLQIIRQLKVSILNNILGTSRYVFTLNGFFKLIPFHLFMDRERNFY